jgi:hypothetical protein
VFWSGRKPSTVDATQLRKITSAGELPSQRELVSAVKEAATRQQSPKKT